MALNVSSSKTKVDEIVRSVKDYSVLVGGVDPQKKVDNLPCVPGLNMLSESESLYCLSKDLESGLFNLLVMGKFKNGKSTFVNALLGKMIMAAKTTATTAVIAIVEYGTDEKIVRVFENGRDCPRYISLEEFTKKFSLTEEDQRIIEEGGNVDRFAGVDYVVMQSSAPMFENGVRLIDSPGLEEAHSRTKTTTEFVPRANAIIFTLTALSLFSAYERKYINENFVGKGLRNVFFVVNRVDQLMEENALENTVMPAMRAHLEGVFTDENGRFDEELYNKRVFYTNAYGALCARTGEDYTVHVGKKDITVEVEIEDTGMPEFEAALNEFLNSDERLKATFQSTLTSMANFYQSADIKIANEKKARALPLKDLEANAEKAKKALDELRSQAEKLKNTISKSGEGISKTIYDSMLKCAKEDIPNGFPAAMEGTKIDFGILQMFKLCVVSAKGMVTRKDTGEEVNEIIKPLIPKVNEYVKGQMEKWKDTVPTLIDQELHDLEEEIGQSVSDFDMGLDRVVEIFATGNADKAYSPNQKGNALQTIIALYNWDVSLAVESMANGGMKWGDFIKRIIVQIGLDLAVTVILGAPYLIPALVIELFSMIFRGSQMGKQMQNKVGTESINALAKRIQEEELNIKQQIQAPFIKQSDEICAAALKLINDKQAELDKILEEKRKNETDAAAEGERQDEVLKAMRARFDTVYHALYGRNSSDEDLAKLTKTE